MLDAGVHFGGQVGVKDCFKSVVFRDLWEVSGISFQRKLKDVQDCAHFADAYVCVTA